MDPCGITSPPYASTTIFPASISALRRRASSIFCLTSRDVARGRNWIEWLFPPSFGAPGGILGSLPLIIPLDLSFKGDPAVIDDGLSAKQTTKRVCVRPGPYLLNPNP